MVARTAFSVVFVSLQATAQQWCSEQTKGGCSGLRLKRRNYNTVSDKVFFFFFGHFLYCIPAAPHNITVRQQPSPN